MKPVPHDIERALRNFSARVAKRFGSATFLIYGSRARGEGRPTSDVDVAVLFGAPSGRRLEVALEMADIAFDVFLDTGLLIEPVPLWQDEWENPEHFANPSFIKNVRRDAVRL
jgi:predicted nucleotidyltransferase